MDIGYDINTVETLLFQSFICITVFMYMLGIYFKSRAPFSLAAPCINVAYHIAICFQKQNSLLFFFGLIGATKHHRDAKSTFDQKFQIFLRGKNEVYDHLRS